MVEFFCGFVSLTFFFSELVPPCYWNISCVIVDSETSNLGDALHMQMVLAQIPVGVIFF